MRRITAIIAALIIGVLSGYLAVKAGVSKAYGAQFYNAGTYNQSVITLTDSYNIDNLYADIKDTVGFVGIYTDEALQASITEDDDKFDSIIAFESEYANKTPYVIDEGRELSADDANGATINVVVGGERWKNYSVGDTLSVTVKSALAQKAMTICIVGTVKTPFYATGLLAGVDDPFKTLGGVMIFPSCPAEFARSNNRVVVCYTGLELLSKLRTDAAINGYSMTNAQLDLNYVQTVDDRERQAKNSTLWSVLAIILALSVIASAFVLKREDKASLYCLLSGVACAVGVFVGWLLRTTVPDSDIAFSAVLTAAVIAAVCAVAAGGVAAAIAYFAKRSTTQNKA